MQQYRIVVAGTLAAACLALGGSGSAFAEEEWYDTRWATGPTRKAACLSAESQVSSAVYFPDEITKRDGCKCTAERTTRGVFVDEEWTCEIKFYYRVGPSKAELEERRRFDERMKEIDRETTRLEQEAHDARYGTDR